MRSPLSPILGALAGWAMVGSALAATPPAPAKPVELQRYLGRWYEIARVPNEFERGADCSAPTADYSQTHSGGVAVIQTCHRGSPGGAETVYHASGKILDPGMNTRLRLTYYYLVSKDYWVLDHAGDYGWAIVGDPSGKYLWLLSRAPNLAPPTRADLLQKIRGLGYDVARLEFPAQK